MMLDETKLNKYMRLLTFVVCIILTSCKSNFSNNKENKTILFQSDFVNNSNITLLEKWHLENKKKHKQNEIIVAVLDSQIDINHEDLKDQIWVNKKEILGNKIDEDENGYIDDVNGWNFTGHKSNNFTRYRNFEYSRIVRLKKEYLKLNIKIPSDTLLFLNEYSLIDNKQKEELVYHKNWLKSIEYAFRIRPKTIDTLKYFFPKEDYTYEQLDSLYKKNKINEKTFKQRRDTNDSDLGALINSMMIAIQMGLKEKEQLFESKNQLDSIVNRNLNIDYDDRKFIDDNSYVLEKGYGNNKLNNNIYQLTHCTEVSSVIGGQRNNVGVNGFHNKIRIMPLCISVSGDEHDKDIAMAIYYAVDNGAKVINMSFGKEFTLNQEWVTDAFRYAEKHNVLLVHSSGNNNFNVDKNSYYPSDIDYVRNKDNELVGNFINVGSISKRTDSTMVSPFSNYGKENVDIFAPGEEIYVAKPNNEYGYDSGTSLAGPMVSGTAALIWLYYPKLTVHQVKNIILESGISIDKMVVKPGTKDEMVPFSDLCKTGKILNTYNAMMLAKKVSKQ